MRENRIRVPADALKTVRVCEKGKHETPLMVGGGAAYDWEATEVEFDLWHSLKDSKRKELLQQASEGCFLCALDQLLASIVKLR
jgi:hypothetical protein